MDSTPPTTDSTTDTLALAWQQGCEQLSHLRRRFCSDPLEEEGLSWFSNFCMHMRYAVGAVPGLAKVVAHAVVPGVCRNAGREFFYCYSGHSDPAPSKKEN